MKEAIFTENGKEYFIKYNEMGNEISKKRTFGLFLKIFIIKKNNKKIFYN